MDKPELTDSIKVMSDEIACSNNLAILNSMKDSKAESKPQPSTLNGDNITDPLLYPTDVNHIMIDVIQNHPNSKIASYLKNINDEKQDTGTRTSNKKDVQQQKGEVNNTELEINDVSSEAEATTLSSANPSGSHGKHL